MKTYKDFYKLKINESFDEDEDEDNEDLVDYNEYLLDDGDGKYYPNSKNDIYLLKLDTQDGELVPELVDYFEAGINASGIGLKTLKYFPSDYCKYLYISNNQLTSLEYCPTIIEGDFDCSENPLTSLENGPTKVDYDYSAINTLITDLEGFPTIVDGNNINLHKNKNLKSLKGIEHIKYIDSLNLYNCINLESLKYLPKSIRYIDIEGTKVKSLKELSNISIESLVYDIKYLTHLEVDFYNENRNNLEYEEYDQMLIDFILKELKFDGAHIDVSEIGKIEIDFNNIKISDKDLRLLNSYKTINKFNL